MSSKKALGALLVAGAVLCVIVPQPSLAATAGEVLWRYEHGGEADPRWTMLKLDIHETTKLSISPDFSQMRCPSTWGWVLFTGSPERATQHGSRVFDFAMGEGGARARVAGAGELDLMHESGAEWCPKPDFGLTLAGLPAGTMYLLEFAAGTPFRASATLRVESGSLDVVGVATGERTMYLGVDDFGGGTHAASYSPATCVGPGEATGVACGVAGADHDAGSFANLDVGFEREASFEFEHHPYFVFGSTTGEVKARNASVVDPLGSVLLPLGSPAARLGGVELGGTTIMTRGANDLYPSGVYTFRIGSNVDAASRQSPAWHAYGVDYEFPEEQASA